jgi:sirohydrochlorin cobaltochelatase
LKPGIVLFAHGSRDQDWARPFRSLADTLRKRVDGPVEIAYLEFMEPTLEQAISMLARDGINAVRIVPVFLAQGGHLKKDLPRLAADAGQKFPQMKIELAPAIGEQPGVIEAIAAAIARDA